MLSMFNRYLSRIRANHPVFGEKEILVVILDFLSGEDLFQMFQVCYSFRAAIQSVPVLEITLIKFTISKSNQCIEMLKGPDSRKQRYEDIGRNHFPGSFNRRKIWTVHEKKEEQKNVENKIDEVVIDFRDPKWVKFKKSFHEYASNNGLKILQKDDFDDPRQWKDYKIKYITFYHNYIDSIRQKEIKEKAFRDFKRKLFNQYRTYVENFNFSFHKCTNFRFFKPKPNPYLPLKAEYTKESN
jgi:hypothetical protein